MKMQEEKGQHVINPATQETILKTTGPVTEKVSGFVALT